MKQLLPAAALFVPLVLVCDGSSLTRQLLLGAFTAIFLAIAASHTRVDARAILCAVCLATAGEVFASILWRLYSYRFTTLIPLYVPFGHGLFYLLAAATARERVLQRHERTIIAFVLIGGSIVAIAQLALMNDQWGMLWWIGAVVLIARSNHKLLASMCCVYTMALEWLGTGLGNWRWAADVPLLHLRSANPPSGVGILYILVDLVTCIIIGAGFSSHNWQTDDRTRTAEV